MPGLFFSNQKKLKKHDWLRNKPIAHRGLHDGVIVYENTIEAFSRAISKHYPIELDVRLTRDNQVIVFHDASLDRWFDSKKKICNLRLNELKEYSNNYKYTIPTLKEVLLHVDGKVPVLIEVKDSDKVGILVKEIHKLIYRYKGELALQSFSYKILREIKSLNLNIPYGYLSSGKESKVKPIFFCMREYLKILLINPVFISYKHDKLEKWYSFALRKRYIVILWTIKSKNDALAVPSKADNFIFEGFGI